MLLRRHLHACHRYERASPAKRSLTICKKVPEGEIAPALANGGGGEGGGAEEHETPDGHVKHSFGVRLAAKHHTGVQREILGAFHGSGVDVLEAHVYAVDHPSTKTIDAFVASYRRRALTLSWLGEKVTYNGGRFPLCCSYRVVSRGKKKDFDDEKLHDIHHALSEVLNDNNSQARLHQLCSSTPALAPPRPSRGVNCILGADLLRADG